MNILITGFPYSRAAYRDTFKAYPVGDALFFLLPKRWSIKKGSVVFEAPIEPNVVPAHAFFYHSTYPFIGGILKGWMPSFPLALYRLKRKQTIDLVYSCSEPILLTTLYQAIWTRLLGSRHVFFSWENIAYERKFRGINLFVKKCIFTLNSMLSDGIICGNQEGAAIFRNYTHTAIDVIPMSGVDTDFFQPAPKTHGVYGHNLTGKMVFTFAGAIGYRKGISYLLEAFALVRKEIPEAFLIIAGSGEYEHELRAMIQASNLSDDILVIPWLDRDQLKLLLNESDVFVYPSIAYGGWEEQFGYSMAEALLMEVSVVATRTGSIGQVVIHGETGILIEPNSASSLKDAMVQLGRDGVLRQRLGQAGRRSITEQFSYTVVARKFQSFFHRVIST